jgi:hypothetical protein
MSACGDELRQQEFRFAAGIFEGHSVNIKPLALK